jgi:hypothetical protein
MFKQNINVFIALAMVASVGIGASYLIISFANATDFSYISTETSIILQAEIQKPDAQVEE